MPDREDIVEFVNGKKSELAGCFFNDESISRSMSVDVEGRRFTAEELARTNALVINESGTMLSIKIANFSQPKRFFGPIIAFAEAASAAADESVVPLILGVINFFNGIKNGITIALSREEAYIIFCVYAMTKDNPDISEDELFSFATNPDRLKKESFTDFGYDEFIFAVDALTSKRILALDSGFVYIIESVTF